MPRQMKDSGVTWIREIADSHPLRKLKYVCQILDQYRSPITADQRSQEGPVLYDYYGASGAIDKIDDYTIDDHVMLIGEDGANLRMRNLPLIYEINGKAWVNNHAHILKPNPETDFYYLFYALESLDINPYITGSAQPKLSQDSLKNILVPFPELEEQQRISVFLNQKCSYIDSVLKQTRSSIEEYKKLKQAFITEVVTRGIRESRLMKDSGISWLSSIPKNWSVEKGKHLFAETKELSETGEEELLTVSHITGVTPRSQKNVNMFMSESLVGYKICHVGDLAANTMWMWQGAIGVSMYEGVISPSYNTYRQRNNDFIPEYLEYLLRIPPLVATYSAYSTGITASRLRLYPDQFFSILFPVPPKEEQREIVRYLDGKIPEMDRLIEKKEQFLVELENYKKSMIYEYVTGKKEVPQS